MTIVYPILVQTVYKQTQVTTVNTNITKPVKYQGILYVIFDEPSGGFGKLERSITEWSSWIKTTAERRGETSDDQWEPEERPTGLTRMVQVFASIQVYKYANLYIICYI